MSSLIPLDLAQGERKVLSTYLSEIDYTGNPLSSKLARDIIKDLKAGRRRQARFRLYSKRTMDNYEEAGKWSSYEKRARDLLQSVGIKVGKNYFHNFKIQNKEQNGYFSLDMLFPLIRVDLEFDGDIWHKIGDASLKDIKRDKWLEELGIRVVRLNSKHFKLEDRTLTSLLLKCLFNTPLKEPEIRCKACGIDFPSDFRFCPLCSKELREMS